jgi:hypothetical protein
MLAVIILGILLCQKRCWHLSSSCLPAVASKQTPRTQFSTKSSMEHGCGKLVICKIYGKEWLLAIEQYIAHDNRSKQFSWCNMLAICKRAQAG